MNTARKLLPDVPRDANGDWEREYIVYRLRKALAGQSFAQFAAGLGLYHGAVTDVLRGDSSRRLQSEIAARIGVEAREIWPSRYAEPRSGKERRQAERRCGERRQTIRNVGLTA